jgi:hypothetical protein
MGIMLGVLKTLVMLSAVFRQLRRGILSAQHGRRLQEQLGSPMAVGIYGTVFLPTRLLR